MREDLLMLMKENSRVRGRRLRTPKGYSRQQARYAEDEQPTRESNRIWGRQGMERGLSMKPLRRYLASQVGRPWDDVYSDLNRHASLGGENLRGEMRDWVGSIVELHVEMIDGVPYSKNGYAISSWGRWRELWVHPQTGMLMGVEPEPRRSYKPRKQFEQIVLGNDRRRAVKIDGIWYEVRFLDIPPVSDDPDVPLPYDVAFREHIYRRRASRSSMYRTGIEKQVSEWGGAIYAAEKRQMNSREIRRMLKSQSQNAEAS